MNTALDWL